MGDVFQDFFSVRVLLRTSSNNSSVSINNIYSANNNSIYLSGIYILQIDIKMEIYYITEISTYSYLNINRYVTIDEKCLDSTNNTKF